MLEDGIIQGLEYNILSDVDATEQQIFEYCHNVAVIDYKFCDEKIEKVWTSLTVQVNDIINLVSGVIPKYLVELRRNRRKDGIQNVHSISLWRKHLGALLMQYLRCAEIWLNTSEDECILKEDLCRARREYDSTYLNMQINDFLKETCQLEGVTL